MRNKYAEDELIILDEVLIVSKKVCYQTHYALKETFNLPILPFASRSILVVWGFHQFPAVGAMPVHVSGLVVDHTES